MSTGTPVCSAWPVNIAVCTDREVASGSCPVLPPPLHLGHMVHGQQQVRVGVLLHEATERRDVVVRGRLVAEVKADL